MGATKILLKKILIRCTLYVDGSIEFKMIGNFVISLQCFVMVEYLIINKIGKKNTQILG